MGVSLERVQFKFASIIGELCSQPDVLSQFAVWLDLRLAEYKLKGAISLDCSGEEPDPVWLKGLSKQKSVSKLNSQTDRRTQSHSPAAAYRSPSLQRLAHPSSDSDIPLSQSHAVSSAELAERLSPEVVVVKEEPDVYPVTLHARENRKRSATDTISIDFRDVAKQRKPVSTTESPSHQSLMSVIGGFENLNEETFNRGDNSFMCSEGSEVADKSIDLPVEPSDLNAPNMQWLTEATAIMTQPVTKALTETGENGSACSVPGFVSRGRESPGGNRDLDQRSRYLFPKTSKHYSQFIRSRIHNGHLMSKARISNIVVAVKTFERWLHQRPYNDKRRIFEIPPEVLDQYLAEFFSKVKAPSGAEYKLETLQSIRSNLLRYLRDNGYVENILASPLFTRFQFAWRERVARENKVCLQTATTGPVATTTVGALTTTTSRACTLKPQQGTNSV